MATNPRKRGRPHRGDKLYVPGDRTPRGSQNPNGTSFRKWGRVGQPVRGQIPGVTKRPQATLLPPAAPQPYWNRSDSAQARGIARRRPRHA